MSLVEGENEVLNSLDLALLNDQTPMQVRIGVINECIQLAPNQLSLSSKRAPFAM